jgi:hypothetical protein
MAWTHDISQVTAHFLDIVTAVDQAHGFVYFHAALFSKPAFKPHYLSVLSNHPGCHRLCSNVYAPMSEHFGSNVYAPMSMLYELRSISDPMSMLQ